VHTQERVLLRQGIRVIREHVPEKYVTRCAVVTDLSRPDAVGQWVSWKLAISPWGVCGGDPTSPIPLKQGSEGQDNENATSAAKCVHTDRISGDSKVIMRDDPG
jgi:hypothetical protein